MVDCTWELKFMVGGEEQDGGQREDGK